VTQVAVGRLTGGIPLFVFLLASLTDTGLSELISVETPQGHGYGGMGADCGSRGGSGTVTSAAAACGNRKSHGRCKCVRSYTFTSTFGRIVGMRYHHHRPAVGCFR
jgi:hypothetical protein